MKTSRPRRRFRRRYLAIPIVVLLVVAAAGFAAKELLFSYATRNVAQENLLGPAGNQAAQERQHVDVTGAKTLLLIGLDARPDQKPTDPVRADTILVLHIPAAHDRAYVMSIPRDTWVKVPSYDNGTGTVGGRNDKINGAYAAGGQGLTGADARRHAVTLLALTIKQEWGIGFDGAAIIDFVGFQKVVQVLGGVDMYIDQRTVSVHIGYNDKGQRRTPFRQYTKNDGSIGLDPIAGVRPNVYQVGHRHLSAEEALDYIRQRETLPNSDYDRQRHQQQFLKAVFGAMLSRDTFTNPVRLAELLDVVGRSMTIDSGGIDLEDWLYAMRGIGGDDLVTIKTNNGTFHASPRNSSAEALDADTLALLEAIRTSTVGDYVAAHPHLVTTG